MGVGSRRWRDRLAKSHQRAPGGAPKSMTGNLQSLICEESENDTFRFPWSKRPRMDFLRPYQVDGKNRSSTRPVWGARINDG